MEEEKAESYRALYRVRPLIYHIGDIRLWVPIRQDGIILWFVYVALFFVFCYVFPVLAWVIPVDRIIVMLVGPILAAYYSVKLDPAGKTVPRFLLDGLLFLVRPKWMIGWREVRFSGKKVRIHFEGWCRPYSVHACAGGMMEWRGGRAQMHGNVKNLSFLRVPSRVRVKWKESRGRLEFIPIKTNKSLPAAWPKPFIKTQNLNWTTNEAVDVQIAASGQWEMKSVHFRFNEVSKYGPLETFDQNQRHLGPGLDERGKNG